MLIIFAIAALVAVVRVAWGICQSLRALPRSNADWIFF